MDLSKLRERHATLLLGEPGSGKSTAIRELHRELSSTQDETALIAFSDIGTLTDLERQLSIIEFGDSSLERTLLLDGIDEIRGVQKVVPFVRGIVEKCQSNGWRLVATSRTAETLPGIPAVFDEVEAGAVHVLLPLRRPDAAKLAADLGVADAERFLSAVTSNDVGELAANPLTLALLVQMFLLDGDLPPGRVRLLDRATSLLLSTAARPDDQPLFPPDNDATTQRTAVARLAAFMALTGATGAGLAVPGSEAAGFPTESAAGREQIDNAPRDVTNAHLQAALLTPLFLDAGNGERHFAHRILRDFLAAEALTRWGLSRQQLSSLLTTSSGGASSIPPQMLDVATALVAGSTTFDWLLQIDPLNLARNKLGRLRPDLSSTLVAGLLKEPMKADYLIGWADQLGGLAHRELAPQLRSSLQGHDESSMFVSLRVLVDSYTPGLEAELVAIARGESTPIRCRAEAVRVLAANGRIDEVRALPLNDPSFFEADMQCQLRGTILEVLYPTSLTLGDLLDLLVPEPESFYGSYSSFLHDFGQGLSTRDAGQVLRWWASGPAAFRGVDADPPGRFGILRLIDAASAEWVARSVTDDRTDDALIAVLVPLIEGSASSLPIARGESSRERWQEIMTRLVIRLGASADRITWFRDSQNKNLIGVDDFIWVVARANEDDAAPSSIWSRLAGRILSVGSAEHLAFIWRCAGTPMWESLSRRYVLMDLQSDEALEEKRHWNQLQSIDTPKAKEPIPRSDYVEDIHAWIDEVTRAPELFWRLARALDADPQLQAYSLRGNPDLLGSAAGDLLDRGSRQEILAQALRYLTAAPMVLPKRRRPDRIYYAAEALFRAAYTLEIHAPGLYEGDREVAWDALAAATLEYENYGDVREKVSSVRRIILKRIEQASPDELQNAIAKHLRSVARMEFPPPSVNDIEDVINGRNVRLVRRLIPLASSSVRDGLLELLRRVDPDSAINASILLASKSAEVAVMASCLRVLFADSPKAAVRIARARSKTAPELTRLALLVVASSRHGISRFPSTMTDELKANLYELLAEIFPPTSDEHQLGVHSVTSREEAARWRDGQLSDLIQEGTDDAIRVLTRLDRRHMGLEWAVIMAFETFRQSSWRPPTVSEINLLLSRRDTRLINSSDDLLREVVNALSTIQEWLVGETPQSFALWNRIGSQAIPKDEGRISDWYCHALATELRDTNVLINREVEVRNKTGKGVGDRNDIRVAVRDREADRNYVVVIEVKGIWNTEVRTHLLDQLADRYLEQNGLTHGVYLVVKFKPSEITNVDKRRASLNNARGVRKLLTDQANSRRPELQIEPIIHHAIFG
ncbi:NACHT domain-containing protein [Leifsonia sp. NPDC056665]|uniref:NACHT domain-containing protein n=1 Tax=Leifsonia sp. NPDC056665 TaxID=3345901 RepID=UPI0036980353